MARSPSATSGISACTTSELAAALELAPHPEGGFFRETYRGSSDVSLAGFPGPRSVSTAIYFLVPAGSFSALHRIRSDEVWHHYAGASLEVVSILPDGSRRDLLLGTDLLARERPQGVVPRGRVVRRAHRGG